MEKYILLVLTSFFMVSCNMPWSTPSSSTGSVSGTMYPTTQSDSPAARYCTSKNGKFSEETQSGVVMPIAYCTLPDGQKFDAWRWMSEQTIMMTGSQGGGTVEAIKVIE